MELVERLPTADEYVELLHRVGWTAPPVEDCQRALGGSLAAICAVDERRAVVGMGRLVGDGRMYCFAVDVVVDPDVQGQGIGQGIMDALEALVTRRQLGTRLDLVAAPDVAPFYRRLGYSELPSDLMRKPLEPGPCSRMTCVSVASVAYEAGSTTLVTTQRCLPILRSRTNPRFS